MRQGSLVKITRPRYTQGGVSAFQDRLARIKAVKGSVLSLVLLGETEKYMFWVSEVDLIEP
jgi:hypothetical protein